MTERQTGIWKVERSIVDFQTGETTACNGEAYISRCKNGLRYAETVVLWVTGRQIKATQTYLYCPNGSNVTARFADGRMFFVATFQADGSATAVHHCGADLYTGTFRLCADRWSVLWAVSGTKALQIKTNYTRSVP